MGKRAGPEIAVVQKDFIFGNNELPPNLPPVLSSFRSKEEFAVEIPAAPATASAL
jgi:hypothetical protein